MATVRELINGFVWEHIEFCASLVDKDGEDTVFHGIRVMDEENKYVHGALINATAQLYIHYAKENDARAAITLERLEKFISFVTEGICQHWAKLAILRALGSLKDAGLLERLKPATLEILKEKTEYTDFFDKEALVVLGGYPTNYMQVAMACAGFREMLGFENDGYCEKILQKLLSIMDTGAIDGWMDEQPPFGRFDRYSMIVSSEISDTLDAVHKDVPEITLKNLREIAKICVFMANEKGDGINYGRSLSCHGDGACVEAIASAFSRGLIDESDKELALAYSVKIIEKILGFWFNREKRSFDIWWNGRSTNRYRHLQRVLEVNLDMSIHLITTLKNFEKAGLAHVEPSAAIPKPNNWVARTVHYINDANKKSQTVILRKGDTMAMLPLIGLGSHLHLAAYQPYPAICNILEGAPEAKMPFLVPEYTLADGTRARPIQHYTNVTKSSADGCVQITAYGQLCNMADRYAKPLNNTFKTVYTFKGNQIRVSFETDADVKITEMVVGLHSDSYSIQPIGFEQSEAMETDGVFDFMTPHGPIVKAQRVTTTGGKSVGYTVSL